MTALDLEQLRESFTQELSLYFRTDGSNYEYAVAAFDRAIDAATLPSCRVCGCTDEIACDDGCEWVEPDLCSACVEDVEPEAERDASSSFWADWSSKRYLKDAARNWGPPSPVCGDVAPTPDAECSRPPGHAGRHMASVDDYRVVAAWPGWHAVKLIDLHEVIDR
jgi:hypothetical protein